MDLINKLRVLMKISLAGTEVAGNNESRSSSNGSGRHLSHHYLAQCLHKQCDMYELREMCRLQQVEVKRGAGKREIIESLIDHLPDVNLLPSPKEVANKTRKTGNNKKKASPSVSPRPAKSEDTQNLQRGSG